MKKEFLGSSDEKGSKRAWLGLEWLSQLSGSGSTRAWSHLDKEYLRTKKQEVGEALKLAGDETRKGLKWGWHFVADSDKGAAHNLQSLPDVQAQQDWLRELLWPYRNAYRQALALSFATNILGLFAAVFSMQVYDQVVGHEGYSTLAALVIGMAIAIVMDHVFRAGRSLLLQRIGARVEVELARETLQRMLNLPTLALEARSPGFWQAVYRDIEIVRATCSGATAMLVIDLPFVLLSLLVIAFVALPLLPVALLTIAAFVALA